jgi:hypothetical protein
MRIVGKSLNYVPTASGRVMSGKEISYQYANSRQIFEIRTDSLSKGKIREGGQCKSLAYVPTASGRVRSGKEASCEYENLGKSLYYIPTASGRARSGKEASR